MQNWKETWKRITVTVAVIGGILSGTVWYAKEYTTVGNSVNGREMPICSVETEKKQMSLTFETAWGAQRTEKVLDILWEERVKATFFMTLGWMQEHKEIVERMEQEGHDIGTLGVSHENLSQKVHAEQKKELEAVRELAEKENRIVELFRPPYGRYNEELLDVAKENGFYTICWSLDSLDWKNYGAETVLKTILESQEFKSGSILRLNSEAEDTEEGLGELIREGKKKGYEWIRVSELIVREDYHLDVAGRQIPGMT